MAPVFGSKICLGLKAIVRFANHYMSNGHGRFGPRERTPRLFGGQSRQRCLLQPGSACHAGIELGRD
jgi:hypothetical protein